MLPLSIITYLLNSPPLMNALTKNILAVVLGIAAGSAVNMGIIMLSSHLIPPPAGADISTPEGLKAAIPLFEPKHFIMPFLAHALGTLVGAWVAALVAATQKMRFALGIGFFFLLGGIANVLMLPSPLWFTLADLALAYLPMGFLGGKLALGNKG